MFRPPGSWPRVRTSMERREAGSQRYNPMTETDQAVADRRLEAALDETGACDPRASCRDRLRALKGVDPDAFQQAVDYYRGELIPAIASGAEPLTAWIEYGRRIARLTFDGRTVAIDETGLAREYSAPVDPDALVLHLPKGGRQRALLVALPREPSPAQQATCDLLVDGRSNLREG